jgi:hypothetical protein
MIALHTYILVDYCVHTACNIHYPLIREIFSFRVSFEMKVENKAQRDAPHFRYCVTPMMDGMASGMDHARRRDARYCISYHANRDGAHAISMGHGVAWPWAMPWAIDLGCGGVLVLRGHTTHPSLSSSHTPAYPFPESRSVCARGVRSAYSSFPREHSGVCRGVRSAYSSFPDEDSGCARGVRSAYSSFSAKHSGACTGCTVRLLFLVPSV